MTDADITLAIQVDDISIYECLFHAEPPTAAGAPEIQLKVANPTSRFSFNPETRRTTLQSTVGVRFALANPKSPEAPEAETTDFLTFNLVVGVIASIAVTGEAAMLGRHMVGAAEDSAAQRDKNTERALRLEAIKAAYSLASVKLAELSAMSPLGKLVMPAIDADSILIDMQKDGA